MQMAVIKSEPLPGLSPDKGLTTTMCINNDAIYEAHNDGR